MAKLKETRWILRALRRGGYQVVEVPADFDEDHDEFDPSVNDVPVIESRAEAEALLLAKHAPPPDDAGDMSD